MRPTKGPRMKELKTKYFVLDSEEFERIQTYELSDKVIAYMCGFEDSDCLHILKTRMRIESYANGTILEIIYVERKQ